MEIVADVVQLVGTPPLPGCDLVIDGTGCGRAVADLFRPAAVRAVIKPVLITAGQAVSRNLTLVTHNTQEFARVPGLRLEDWEA